MKVERIPFSLQIATKMVIDSRIANIGELSDKPTVPRSESVGGITTEEENTRRILASLQVNSYGVGMSARLIRDRHNDSPTIRARADWQQGPEKLSQPGIFIENKILRICYINLRTLPIRIFKWHEYFHKSYYLARSAVIALSLFNPKRDLLMCCVREPNRL